MWKQGIARGVWLVTLAPGFLAAALAAGPPSVRDEGEVGGPRLTAPRVRAAPRILAAPRVRAAPRVACARPRTLRLRRFEDRSAQLLCARRVIVRISAPG